MEPLRHCRTAKFFRMDPITKQASEGRGGMQQQEEAVPEEHGRPVVGRQPGSLRASASATPGRRPDCLRLLPCRFSQAPIFLFTHAPLPPPLLLLPLQFSPIPGDLPPCPRCIPDLVGAPAPKGVPCTYCGAVRMSLYDLSGEQLKVPEVCTVSRQQQQREGRGRGRGE